MFFKKLTDTNFFKWLNGEFSWGFVFGVGLSVALFFTVVLVEKAIAPYPDNFDNYSLVTTRITTTPSLTPTTLPLTTPVPIVPELFDLPISGDGTCKNTEGECQQEE